jgi:hypothetical protein
MQRFDNWMSYSFGGVEHSPKRFSQDIPKLHFNKKISRDLPSYRDALINNAKIMRDSYTEPFDVCLSGGTDSEVAVRAFKTAGISHNTFIFKLEDNINVRDVAGAIELCDELNISYKIIDFNLKKFFENEAESLFNKVWVPHAGRLPRLKFIDYLDNIPVFCDGEPYWRRQLEEDYTVKSPWKFYLIEDSYAVSLYSSQIGRTVIGDWYEYTPEVIMSYKELPYVRQLLNDEIPGKISNATSKGIIHQAYWPDLKIKSKLVGYEGSDGVPGSRPPYITEFYLKHMKYIEGRVWRYTEEELDNLIFK